MIITEKKISDIRTFSFEEADILKINNKEIESITSKSEDIRYLYSQKRIADTEIIWILLSRERNIIFQVTENNENLLPIWPAKTYGDIFKSEEDPSWNCVGITLDFFTDYLIDFVVKEDVRINVFPTNVYKIGKIVKLLEFCNDLKKELDNYY